MEFKQEGGRGQIYWTPWEGATQTCNPTDQWPARDLQAALPPQLQFHASRVRKLLYNTSIKNRAIVIMVWVY